MGSATIQTDKHSMPIFRVSDPAQTELLALTCLFCAYQACGTEIGMGIFQAVDSMQPEDVERYCHKDKRAYFVLAGDCRPDPALNLSTDGFYTWSADYLAGRMVKTTVSFHVDGYISIPSAAPNPGYQGWASCKGPADDRVSRENLFVHAARPIREAMNGQPPTFSTYQELLEHAADCIGVTVTPV